VLPGVTVLFGFLLAVPFYVAFNTATGAAVQRLLRRFPVERRRLCVPDHAVAKRRR
jgi:hypothetical protein